MNKYVEVALAHERQRTLDIQAVIKELNLMREAEGILKRAGHRQAAGEVAEMLKARFLSEKLSATWDEQKQSYVFTSSEYVIWEKAIMRIEKPKEEE